MIFSLHLSIHGVVVVVGRVWPSGPYAKLASLCFYVIVIMLSPVVVCGGLDWRCCNFVVKLFQLSKAECVARGRVITRQSGTIPKSSVMSIIVLS